MPSEVRVDPLSGHKAIVATKRAARPGALLAFGAPQRVDPDEDPFAEGHEERTPPELFALRDGGPADGPGWTVRVVPNRFPAVGVDSPDPAPSATPDLFASSAASGAHEVIVSSPSPAVSLSDLPREQVVAAVGVWRERMRAHESAAALHLFVNERLEAGASLPHTHAQLLALDFVPADLARERERFGAHAARTMGANLLGDLVQEEVKLDERVVAVDDEAVLLAPYASRLPYQLMVAPRRPRDRFQDDGPLGAAMLHDALCRLAHRLGAPPLNLWVRTAPRGAEHFSWRIEIVPRLAQLAGVELGLGVAVNPVSPEVVAAELRPLG